MPLLDYPDVFGRLGLFDSTDGNTLSVLLLFVLILLFTMSYLLRSDFGIALRATGDSEPMIRSLGVNTTRMKLYGLALSNALVAWSGGLMAQFQGFADINMGIGIVISGLGAVIIGDTLINFMKLRAMLPMLACIIVGVVLFQSMLALALSAGVNPSLLKLTTALLVLAIVALPRVGGALQLAKR